MTLNKTVLISQTRVQLGHEKKNRHFISCKADNLIKQFSHRTGLIYVLHTFCKVASLWRVQYQKNTCFFIVNNYRRF